MRGGGFLISAFAALVGLLALTGPVQAQKEKRIALVIGQSRYQHVPKLLFREWVVFPGRWIVLVLASKLVGLRLLPSSYFIDIHDLGENGSAVCIFSLEEVHPPDAITTIDFLEVGRIWRLHPSPLKYTFVVQMPTRNVIIEITSQSDA